jgi:hypothetical protein
MELVHRSRVAAIAKHLHSNSVFGADGKSGHRFIVTPHSEEEIEHTENQLGVQLPQEYAKFLTRVGSGAGPYYGLFSPSKILSAVGALNQSLAKGTKLPIPGLAFPFRRKDAQAIYQRLENHDSSPYEKAPWLCDGCIPICAQGCTGYNGLVTAGELRGTVWDVNDDGAIAQWLPARRPCGLLVVGFAPRALAALPAPPTFLEWFESWLQRVETDLEDYSPSRREQHR